MSVLVLCDIYKNLFTTNSDAIIYKHIINKQLWKNNEKKQYLHLKI